MSYYIMDYQKMMVQISQDQLKNCTLYKDKFTALQELLSDNIDFLEIGVLAGDYSKVVIDNKKINRAVLLDTYESDDWEGCYIQRFNKNSHLDFIKKRFEGYDNVFIQKGNSQDVLPLKNEFFDYIYIDADHRFEYVLKDLLNSSKMCKPKGIIGLNDFVIYQHTQEPDKNNRGGFAVAEAVSQFLKINQSWEVVGYSLENHGNHDIYIRRRNMI